MTHRRRPRAALRLRAGQQAAQKHLTSATGEQRIAITMPYWDRRVAAMAKSCPELKVDSSTSTSSPPASCCTPTGSTWSSRATCSATSSPTRPRLHRHHRHRAAERQHQPRPQVPRSSRRIFGSAPDIAARGVADRSALIWSGALMLEHPGPCAAGAPEVRRRSRRCSPTKAPKTRDIGGTAGTREVGEAIAALLR